MTTSMNLKVYNADEMLITVGPVIIDSGYADGEFLSVEQETEDTVDVAGTDGEVAVSRSNDRRATVTISLLQTATANDGLSVLSNLARSSRGMAGAIVPLTIADKNGRTIMTAANAWVQKAPDRSWDRQAGSVDWEVRCAHLVRFDGGNF